MAADRRGRARLFTLQGLLLVLLAVFVLSVRVDLSAPAFGGEWQPETPQALTVSVQGLVFSRRGMAREVMKAAFPILAYAEDLRDDETSPGVLARAAGYLLGFTPRYPRDLAFGGISGFLVDTESLAAPDMPSELEDDWGLLPVLFSLPPGDDATPAAVFSDSGPLVAIYHTHATESFLPEIGKKDAAQAFSDVPSRTVTQIGGMLAQELQNVYRIPSLHSTTVHDKDSRIGAYYRSESTVKAILQKYPSCQVLVDIHRDSQPRSITAVTVRGKPYARILMVVGTDNPRWVQNNEFARKILSKLEEGYPGVSRGVLFESAVYNQKHSPMAILVECGGVDNTMAECKNSVEALAWALASVILPAAPPLPAAGLRP
ncbi:MAG: stage II sporulation protein P [Bacillota bacterium]